jgi:hypothetical protein
MRLSGLMSDEEIASAAETALKEMREQMKTGFTLITDITDFRPLTQEGRKIVRASVAEFSKLQIKHRIRIVGRSAVAAMQMQSETQINTTEPVHIVHSLAEAEALVDQLNKKR